MKTIRLITMFCMIFSLVLFMAGVSVYALEYDTDRPGMDYNNFNLPSPDPKLLAQLSKQVIQKITPISSNRFQLVKQCPDLAVTEIKFQLVSKSGSDAGIVKITGIAKNIGKDLNFSGKLQLFWDQQLLGETPFTAIKSGGQVEVSREKMFFKNVTYISQGFKVKIAYNFVTASKNEVEVVDCDVNNDEKTRPFNDIWSVF